MLAAVSAVDFLCNLDNLLFLQCFCNLDELAGTAVQEGFVHVAHRSQAHDDVPAKGFLENLIRARLVHKIGHLGRVLAGGKLQEQAVVVGHNAPYL